MMKDNSEEEMKKIISEIEKEVGFLLKNGCNL